MVTFGSDLLKAELEASASEAEAVSVEKPSTDDAPREPSSEPTEAAKPAGKSETADDSETPGEGEAAGHFKGRSERSYQRRIAAQNREIADLRAKLAKEEPAPAKTQPSADTEKEPQESDFEDHAEYLKAVGAYGARQAIKQDREREQAEQEHAAFQKKVDAAREKHQDFDERIESVADMVIPQAAVVAISDSDITGDILHHLASHPEEIEALQAMTPVKQALYIGRLEAKLTDSPAEKKTAEPPAPKSRPTASSAPAPIKPVSTSSAEKPAFDPDTADASDPRWVEWRRNRRKELESLNA